METILQITSLNLILLNTICQQVREYKILTLINFMIKNFMILIVNLHKNKKI